MIYFNRLARLVRKRLPELVVLEGWPLLQVVLR